jgi:hypothetical protein
VVLGLPVGEHTRGSRPPAAASQPRSPHGRRLLPGAHNASTPVRQSPHCPRAPPLSSPPLPSPPLPSPPRPAPPRPAPPRPAPHDAPLPHPLPPPAGAAYLTWKGGLLMGGALLRSYPQLQQARDVALAAVGLN